MNKILLSILAILLLSACTPDPPLTASLAWNNLNLATDAKCLATTPTYACDPAKELEALIDVDANGAPTGVNAIQSCEGKKITWKYKNNVADAPQFFVIFNPVVFPGKSGYDPISKPMREHGKVNNQKVTINTRTWGSKHDDDEDDDEDGVVDPECLNYMIVVPDKGILDPVFIIKR